MILFLLGREQILQAFGATENNIEYAREYFVYITLGIPFYMITNSLNSVIRADGSPQFAMISIWTGCVLNVILDPIAIFVLGWEMRGAALATITAPIADLISIIAVVFMMKKVYKELKR